MAKLFKSTKIIELGSACFRQPLADSHCRFLHGYKLYAKFWFTCYELDENNWVLDYGSFKGFKKAIEEKFDHKTIIGEEEPKRLLFDNMEKEGIIELTILEKVGIEAFAEYLHEEINLYIKKNEADWDRGVRCLKVEVFEHEKNSGIYETYY